MPVPKRRTSSSKRDKRRSHHAIKIGGISVCSNCSSVKHPHAICEACGHYRGKQWLEPKASAQHDAGFSTEG